MSLIQSTNGLGQSIWLDYIRRSFIQSEELQSYIDLGISGMTSNPTIFERAISHSSDYDQQINRLVHQDYSETDIYNELVISDIRIAADSFKQVYERTNGKDGYVSLEVNPLLAHDTQTTINEAKQIFKIVDRPNLMVKIPATTQGLPAISEAISSGININVTLIFSLERYHQVIDAYLSGLESRISSGLQINNIHSVASFFVSRLDTKIDIILETLIQSNTKTMSIAQKLMGKSAVANARIAYQEFLKAFNSGRFENLASRGANLQRPLWASTSTKNPNYSDILYVQELIGKHTVNTIPQETLTAFLDHGKAITTIVNEVNEAYKVIESLESLGISLKKVTQELEDEGVQSFSKSFESLMKSLKEKSNSILL